MNEITINGQSLAVKEYEGKRVITLKEIDTVHGRPEGTAGRNFRANKAHFIEGEDYFKICADEIRRHKIMDISPKSHEDVTLITESGYLMLVKSFTDDLAWKVQRELVNSYFRVKQQMSQMEMIAGIANGCVELEKRTAQLEQKQAELEKKLTTDREETIKAALDFGRIGALQRKQIAKAVKKRAIEICGYAETYDKFGKNVVNSIYKALQKKFNVPSYLDLEYRHYTDAMIFIQCFEPNQKLYAKIIHAQPSPKLGDFLTMLKGV